jgi:hypothetical protein
MAQPIRPAQMEMDFSNLRNNTPGMSRTSSTRGPNSIVDPMSNPARNAQTNQQMFLGRQRATEDMRTGMQGVTTNAIRQQDVAMTAAAEAIAKAQKLKTDTVATVLEASSPASLKMLTETPGMAEEATRSYMTQMAINSDLGDYAGQLMA